jgi:uncharacterized protein DUF1579
MKKLAPYLFAITAVCALAGMAGPARSDDTPMSGGAARPEAMTAPTPGEESKALARFFAKGGTWEGHVYANAMGPGSPETTSRGKAVTHPLYGGFWYACDVEDAVGAGKDAMTWKGHMLVGYDMGEKRYRSVTTDNMGGFYVMDGTLEGDTFTLVTPAPVMMMGQMMNDRLSWTANADGTVSFKDEHKVGDADWMTCETSVMKPMSPAKGASAMKK